MRSLTAAGLCLIAATVLGATRVADASDGTGIEQNWASPDRCAAYVEQRFNSDALGTVPMLGGKLKPRCESFEGQGCVTAIEEYWVYSCQEVAGCGELVSYYYLLDGATEPTLESLRWQLTASGNTTSAGLDSTWAAVLAAFASGF